jgi:UDP-3-O-acyl-N-acetylglucosamine deacetylase
VIFERKTLSDVALLKGVGLHSGEPTTVRVHPKDPTTGDREILFRLGDETTVASPENVVDTQRCTQLGPVRTVEHLMAALAAREITDAIVELSAPEMPAAGGCSIAFTEILDAAGYTSGSTFTVPQLYRRLFLQEGDVKIAVGKGVGHWGCSYISSHWPFRMDFSCQDVVTNFDHEIASARTFAHAYELEMIFKAGLAKGLDEDSALILEAEGYRQVPRFVDEPARHKLLDLMGDLYLAGVPLRALNVSAERNGHTTNVMMAKLLKQAVSTDSN